MSINENSLLAVMNPFYLLLGAFAVCFVGFLCARKYRNTNDFARSVKCYLPWVLVVDVMLAVFLDISLVLIAGLDVCGFITLSLVSNHYFYH